MPVLPSGYVQDPNNLGQSIVTSALNGAFGSGATRKNIADMFHYSSYGGSSPMGSVSFPDAASDWRVRVTMAPNSDYFGLRNKSNALLSPLMNEAPITGVANSLANGVTNIGNKILGAATAIPNTRVGVIFPYTPTISMTHTAKYEPQSLVHNNYTQHYYSSSEVGPISITAEFTVQNVNEGQYLLACIYFFRTITKMFFGQDDNAGNPPPIVYLNGYGQYYLPNVPCVLTSFQHTMPAEVDYMDIPEPTITNSAGYNPSQYNYRLNSTRLPTQSTMVLSLQPVYSRLAQSQGFSLEDFSRGALINSVGSGMPSWSGGASVTASQKVSNTKNGGFL